MLGRFEEKAYFCIVNELALNIEYLLLSHNSVIVPGLGIFTTRTFASQWLEDEEIFLPPVRHIRFNADIFQDPDDILLHSLSQVYSINEEEAQHRIEEMVSDFNRSLLTDNTVDFGSIGLFTLEDDGEITMSPYECGVVSPDYYGLDTLHFPLLSSLPAEEDASPAMTAEHIASGTTESSLPHQPVQETEKNEAPVKNVILPKPRAYVADDKHIIIRLNRAFVHYTMVAAASVLLFFLLGPDVNYEQSAKCVEQATTQVVLSSMSKNDSGNSNVAKKNSQKDVVSAKADAPIAEVEAPVSSAQNSADADAVKAVDATGVSSSELVNSDAVKTTNKLETEAVNIVEEKVKKTDDYVKVFKELTGTHSIVLASAISMKNATLFVKRLQAKDIDAVIYDNGKMLRVVVDGFASQADAYNVNKYLHKLDSELGSTWVMKN